MELQGFMERQKIPSYFLNVTKQPAHITVVQPIGVPASFPECLVAGLGKAENLVPQLCPV